MYTHMYHFQAAELSSLPVIVSPRDADSKLPREQQHRLKLRTNGRLSKLLGDLYLLAGAYSDAVNRYSYNVNIQFMSYVVVL